MLRPMVITYFHDSPLAGHLGAQKSFFKTAANFWWPTMRDEIFQYVRQCGLCQMAKPAQSTRVGWNTTQPSTQSMEKFFLNFVVPLTQTKRGNINIVVIVEIFSKFVWFYRVRRISSQVVVDCLEKNYFASYGSPDTIVTENARLFSLRQIKDLCFHWG